MALMETPQVKNGWQAPEFHGLPGVDGQDYCLHDVAGEKGTVVMFICNHCPYVQAIADRLTSTAEALKKIGVSVIAINANDPVNYPEDSFENMQKFSREHGFNFPYVIDESQEVAREYGAVCTPDIFGFNAKMELQYRGRLDSSGKGTLTPDTKAELVEAMTLIANTGKGPEKQTPSMGCSIKWA